MPVSAFRKWAGYALWMAIILPSSAAAGEEKNKIILSETDDPISFIQSLKKSRQAEAVGNMAVFLDHSLLCVRCCAAQSIGEYGEIAAPFSPKLRALIADTSTPCWLAEDCVTALGKISTGASEDVKCIVTQLEKPSATARLKAFAIQALERLGPKAQAALPALTASLKDIHTDIRWKALCAIRHIHSARRTSAADSIIDLNVLSVEEKVELLNYLAAEHSVQALQFLLRIASDSSNSCYQTAAVEMLGQWLDHPEAVRVLLTAAGGRDEVTGAVARAQLSGLGAGFSEAIPALVDGLSSSNSRERTEAAEILKAYGPAAAPAIPTIVKVFESAGKDSDYAELGMNLDLVRSMGPAGSGAADAITALLPERSPIYANKGKMAVLHLRSFILITLAEIGVPEKALPFIVDYLANFDPSMIRSYVAAIRAAGSLGARAAPLVPFIVKALDRDFLDEAISFEKPFVSFSPNNPGTTARVEAIRALARIGPSAKEALPTIKELARSGQNEALTPDIDLSEVARIALRSIDRNKETEK